MAKRIHKWPGGTHAASRAPFTLLRGEHQARVNKAARCRDRIAEASRHLQANTGRAPDAGDLAALERSEAKLQDQTKVHASLRDVLVDQTIRAYLPENTGRRQAKQRYKGLIKLRQGPLNKPHRAGSAPDAVRCALDTATALEASARQVQAIGQAYQAGDGRIVLSGQMVDELVSLLNGMKMLRPQEQDPADFLYPAVKLMHEANRGAAPGDPLLPKLLRDLGNAGRDDAQGLRAQLMRKCDALDFWLAHHAEESYAHAPAATRQGLAAALDVLLDGLAGAARKVLHEELQACVPGWARQAQAGLFRDAGILHDSAQRWRDHGLAHGDGVAVLQASPAEAVKMLLEQAANEALGTAAAPAGERAPLIHGLRSRLDPLAQVIQRALDEKGLANHATPNEIAALRQSLMQAVLEETGILGEIHRLRAADIPTAASPSQGATPAVGSRQAQPRRAPHPGNLRTASDPFGAPNRPLHSQVLKRMKNAGADAQRQIIKMLTACRQSGDKSLSGHKLRALNGAYAALQAVHGNAAQGVWQALLKDETMRLKDRDLQALNSGVLCARAGGAANPGSVVADDAERAASDRLLDEIWTAVRATSARRSATPLLKSWCASPSATADTVSGPALARQTEVLRDRIGMLEDGKVDVRTLLDAALEELDNRELKALIAALARAPAADSATRATSIRTVDVAATLPFTSRAASGARSAADATTMPAASATAMSAITSAAAAALDAPATQPIDAGTSTLRRRLARLLRGGDRRPSVQAQPAATAPAPAPMNTQVFVDQLYAAARGQAEKRMEALRDTLMPPFLTTLFAQAGVLHAMIDTPEARAVNGPPAKTLERLIRDAVRQGKLTHQSNADTAAALTGTYFLRTTRGYDIVRDLTRTLANETASLHARLAAGMEDLGIAHFCSARAAAEWRDGAIEHILHKTGIWERLDLAVARRAPRIMATQRDAPGLAGIDGRPSLMRGEVRASTRSTQSVDRNGYAIFGALPGRAGMESVPEEAGHAAIDRRVDEPIYATIDQPVDAPIYAAIDQPTDGPADAAIGRHIDEPPYAGVQKRASTVASDDSGIGSADDASQISINGHPYEATRGSAYTTPRTRMANAVDPQLAAALRAALEERNRGAWNRA
ncbi:hypothetical protein AKI39_13770 [Bordetella sp. H567]|uniref:hypothetical protein n=1 Tax=Bordetella sp. H567 TaxID=1697043 RepID=UPI00081C5400|nr:hypothetical protein [Bordetella sp. H567]AOB31525.1 hypothetical protein AKI39_13770 [Bordetella sp. H567]